MRGGDDGQLIMAEFSGHLRLRAEARGDGQTKLAEQSFRAPFHVGKSYWDVAAQTLRVQVVNPTAGILAGDRLESEIAVGRGATRDDAECEPRFSDARG